jgi:hypothetical protein
VSREEGFAFTPLEALALGTPAVVPNLPVFAETLGAGALGVPPGRADALAGALLRLERDCRLRAELVQDRACGRGAPVLEPRGRRHARRVRGGCGPAGDDPFVLVTVIHDSADDLDRLLASVERFLGPRPRIVAVDSGSRDRSPDVAREHGAELVALDGNRGIGVGCNAAVKRVTEPVIVLVNSDVELLDDGLGNARRRGGRHRSSGGAPTS